MGIAVISVCGILLPELAREEAVGKANPPVQWPFLIGAWILAIPIFIALREVLKLLKNIDENMAFSKSTIKVLRNIKYCSIVFAVLIALAAISTVIFVRITAPMEDAPPIFMFGFIFTFVSCVIATFVAVLERLLQNAIDIKAENDLTV
ncbi:MAG: DUF2975 domain-containing protein [Patescibacteria group bacterium]